MILFTTPTTKHLALKISLQPGMYTIKQFSDGELFMRIDSDVKNQTVWVLAATQAPAEHLLELCLLLDALQRSGARINLFITYFSYARQVIAAHGEACSAQVISNILKTFSISKIFIVHPHSALLHDFLTFTAVRDTDFFCKQAQLYDAIVGPDKGAATLAHEVAKVCNKELILLTKRRPEHEKVEIMAVNGVVAHKKLLLVDDMISTGRTLVTAAQTLIKLGASSVSAAATHGVFAPGAREFLAQSIIEKIYVTNTIAQESDDKIVVYDIGTFINNIIQINS